MLPACKSEICKLKTSLIPKELRSSVAHKRMYKSITGKMASARGFTAPDSCLARHWRHFGCDICHVSMALHCLESTSRKNF